MPQNTWWRKHTSAWAKTEIMRQAQGLGICWGQWAWGVQAAFSPRGKISRYLAFSLDLQSTFPRPVSVMGGEHPLGREQGSTRPPGGEQQRTQAPLKRPEARRTWTQNTERKSHQRPIWYIVQILVVCLGQGWHLQFKQDTPGNTDPAGPLATLWKSRFRCYFAQCF